MALNKSERQKRELARAIAQAQHYRNCMRRNPPEPLHRLQFYNKKIQRLAAFIGGPGHGTVGGRSV